MDQRAERAVHNQLVEVTCASDAGQYFLITPKLLTGLRYHENMKVLIINNGTWRESSRFALPILFDADDSSRYGEQGAAIWGYAGLFAKTPAGSCRGVA